MTNQTLPICDDIARLAQDAPPLKMPISGPTEESAWQANKRLAAGLDRVRGEAIQRAKAANARLRKGALAGVTISFGLGVFLGFLMQRRTVTSG